MEMRTSHAPHLAILAAVLTMAVSKTHAQPILCRAVLDDKKRLECYDRATGSTSPPVSSKRDQSAQVVVTTEMRALAASLDQQLLKAGIDIGVFVVAQDSKGLPATSIAYPMLHFFGFLDRPTVYAIVTKLMSGSFAIAKEKGFQTIEFQDKGQNGTYRFDLRKPSPICTRELCF